MERKIFARGTFQGNQGRWVVFLFFFFNVYYVFFPLLIVLSTDGNGIILVVTEVTRQIWCK